jgi:hypothetical protein
MDVTNTIKPAFDRSTVIAPIDEMKESFATHIEVYKTSEGSQFRVVHADSLG